MEADLLSRHGLRSNEFFDDGKDLRELLVVFFLKIFDFASEIAIRIHKPAQLHECAHDRDVHFYRPSAAKHTRKHGDALLGKTYGSARRRPPQLEVTICDFKTPSPRFEITICNFKASNSFFAI